MLKILEIVNDMDVGGSQNLLLSRLNHPKSKKYDITLCTLLQKGIWAKDLDKNIKVINLNFIKGIDISRLFKLIKYVKKNKIDLIVGHLFYSEIIGVLIAILTGCKFIAFRYNIGDWMKKRDVIIERLIDIKCKRIIVNCIDIEKFLIKQNVSKEKIKLIYLSHINLENIKINDKEVRFIKNKYKLNGFKVIGILGNLLPVKDHITFIKAAKTVLKKRSDTKFLIIGDGPLNNELSNFIYKLKLEDKVIITGKIFNAYDYLKILNILVCSSLAEGLPLSLIEGMSLGKPIIATNVGGNKELIKEGINGFLIKPKDYKDLAEKILHILENKKMGKRFGKEDIRLIKENFNLNNSVDEVYEVYDES